MASTTRLLGAEAALELAAQKGTVDGATVVRVHNTHATAGELVTITDAGGGNVRSITVAPKEVVNLIKGSTELIYGNGAGTAKRVAIGFSN